MPVRFPTGQDEFMDLFDAELTSIDTDVTFRLSFSQVFELFINLLLIVMDSTKYIWPNCRRNLEHQTRILHLLRQQYSILMITSNNNISSSIMIFIILILLADLANGRRNL